MRRALVLAMITAAIAILLGTLLPWGAGSAYAGDGTCGEASAEGSTTWYFAEGYTGEGFQEYLTLLNPRDTWAELDLDLLYNEGPSQLVEIDPSTGNTVHYWGLGMTEASGLCYELTGPGGTVIVATTDRCGGYCTCGGSGYQECGPCVSAPDMSPTCAGVGPVPGLHPECCGRECSTTLFNCDWCASNNHPHFDLDTYAFEWVCGDQSILGSCEITAARYFQCLDPNPAWPPGGHCGTDSWQCNSMPQPHMDLVPNTTCCCNWNMCPQADGSCAAAQAPCGAGSCTCAPGQPDADHALTNTGCCCLSGISPQANGTCS